MESTKTLRIQVPNSPDILNPAISRTSIATQIESMMYLPLAIRKYESDQWIPVLIDRYEPEKLPGGGIQYKMSMNPLARWSDGQRVTVDDVLFTLKMSLNPFLKSHSWAAYVELIDTVKINDGQLTLRMNDPYILADEFIASLKPYPKHILDPSGELDRFSFLRMKESTAFNTSDESALQDLAENMNSYGNINNWPSVVSAPFYISSWTADQNIVLVRQDSFWADGDMELGEYFAGNIDTLQYLFISDMQNALHAFTSHKVDLIQSLAEKDTAVIEKSDGKVIEVPTRQLLYISVNHRKPLLGQAKIRKALSLMIHREDLIQKLFQGHGKIAGGPIHPEKSYFMADTDLFNPDKARQILKEMGCKNENKGGVLQCPTKDGMKSMRFHLWTTQSALSRQVATLVKSYWKKLGVDLTIQSADFKTFLPELQNKSYDMATLAVRQNNILDDPYPLWHSSQSGQTGKNYQGMASDSIDQVLEQIRQSMDPAEQKDLYHQLQKLFYIEEPVFFLVAPSEVIGVRNQLELYQIPERPGFDLFRSNIKR